MAKVVLITGANKGIGFEVARQLGRAGFTVLLGARDALRGEEASSKLREEGLDVRFVRPTSIKRAKVRRSLRSKSGQSLGISMCS